MGAEPELPISTAQTTTTVDLSATPAESESEKLLPTSTEQTATATDTSTTPEEEAERFFSNVSQAATLALKQSRPWTEMLDRDAFAKPEDLTVALARLRKNASHFRVNYAIVLIAGVGFSLITNPGSLIILGLLLAAWGYLYNFRRDLLGRIVGRVLNASDRKIHFLLATLTIVFLLTGVGLAVTFALIWGGLVVGVHGAFRVPDDLSLEDQEATGDVGSFKNADGPAVVVSQV